MLATAFAGGGLVSAVQAQPISALASGSATQRLADALHNLARDPQYLPSLIDAGQASLALEDPEAAMGFFRRAEAIAPSDGRIKAGLAAILVRQGQPVEALRLFQQAEQAGESAQAYAADRALAYDLVGDNARAQQDYRVALSLGADAAVTRRLALSQAISGDKAGSEATLLPLLQQSDLAAYRTRAFALAILGETDQAVSIAQDMLPGAISGRLAPYLRYMPRLTKPQQAAAAHLGRFPQAAEIGRENPALAVAARPAAPRAGADARLIPAGAPLGPAAGASSAASLAPNASPSSALAGPASALPAATMSQAAPPASPSLTTAAQVVQGPPAPPMTPAAPEAHSASVSLAATVQPGANVAQPDAGAGFAPAASPMTAASPVTAALASSRPMTVPIPPSSASAALADAVAPAASSIASDAPPSPRDLALAFAEFAEPTPVTVSAQWAVDITSIEPKREAPKVEPTEPPKAKAPPPKPVVPSRHWVQLGTGRDPAALAFDWRRVKRAAGGLLDKSDGHVARWGQTNRLVAGPFASAKEANDLVSKLKEKNVDSFRFTSAQGEEVKPLG